MSKKIIEFSILFRSLSIPAIKINVIKNIAIKNINNNSLIFKLKKSTLKERINNKNIKKREKQELILIC